MRGVPDRNRCVQHLSREPAPILVGAVPRHRASGHPDPRLDFAAPSALCGPGPGGRGCGALEALEPGELVCLVPIEACIGSELWGLGHGDGLALAARLREARARPALACALLLLRELGRRPPWGGGGDAGDGSGAA
ncbi:unnamed protein product, partial [Prorocentrum cordatum]